MKVKEESEKVGLKLNIQKIKIMASGPITSCQQMGKQWKQWETLFWGAPKSLKMATAAMKLRQLLLGRKAMSSLDCMLKSKDITNKFPSSQGYGFSSGHVWMWELNYKESWVLKDWCFWTVVLEKTLESPLDCKEIQPVHPKGNQSWIFIGRTDAEAETPNTLATWCKELTHWKRPWCWERLKVGEKGHDRVWDGWMASLLNGHEFG